LGFRIGSTLRGTVFGRFLLRGVEIVLTGDAIGDLGRSGASETASTRQ
jgi:hypothetical protein